MSDILIVDDERDIRELVSDILEDEGYATRKAGSSEECMAALNEEAPALLILDIWLKDSQMDGIDILKVVKRDMPDIPVVIISGHGNIEIAVAAIKQGDIAIGKGLLEEAIETHPQHFEEAVRSLRALESKVTN